MADKIDVFIIDDDTKSTQYFQAIISKDELIRCIGSTTRADNAVDIVMTAYPDVVLVDYALEPISGFDILATLKAEIPSMPIILLGGHANLREKAEIAGASAYLPMPIIPRTLLDTIRAVSLGMTP